MLTQEEDKTHDSLNHNFNDEEDEEEDKHEGERRVHTDGAVDYI